MITIPTSPEYMLRHGKQRGYWFKDSANPIVEENFSATEKVFRKYKTACQYPIGLSIWQILIFPSSEYLLRMIPRAFMLHIAY